MTDPEQLKTAMSHALLVLKNNTAPTTADVRGAATLVVGLMSGMKVTIEVDELVKHIEAAINVHVGESTMLVNKDDDHLAWLPVRRGELKWSFWRRYRWYLENQRNIPADVVERMDQDTDKILERLEDPRRPGPWDRRGMVVGDVQSGKTSNYSGLICKAADAGYSAIIILAGMHNNLRSQTQERIDTGLLGFDTEKNMKYDNANRWIGVGLLNQSEFRHLPIMALTTSKAQGDFKKNIAESLGIPVLGGTPVVFVVKKQKSVLENLCQWLHDLVGDAAALIIDDEADNASVNTKPLSNEDAVETDPTTINRLIRTLLLKFKKRAYVGYTATPFANIFIHSQTEHSVYGTDLFPSAFILNLHTPSNHVGPAEVFGLPEDRRVGMEEKPGLPVVRSVDAAEAAAFMPLGHKTNHRPQSLPDSMQKAIRSFLLSCAMRGCRGQENEHQSMLVHVTRWVDVQTELRTLVRAEMQALASTLKMEGKGNANLIKELKSLWEKDYVSTTTAVVASWSDPLLTPVTWDCVKKRLATVASRIQVETMNGEAGDVRYYKEAKDGCYIIAIGGDKLSRGLTLEGLTVSYFLRPSHMYDTLMQMGRWFGYRPGYMDACRLFTTDELQDWYQYIACAMLELRKDFDYMSLIGATPQDFGLRVRQHPAELEITAANKMRSGKEMQVSFADTLVESVFFLKKGPNPQNLQAAKELFDRLGKPESMKKKSHYFAWNGVNGKEVIAFLKAYKAPKDAHNSRGSRTDLLTEYIDAQIKVNELTEWTVVLVNNKDNLGDPATSHDFGNGLTVGLRERNNAIQDTASPHYRIIKDHWISPDDEWLDLDDVQMATALGHTIALWQRSTKKNKSETEPEKPTGKGARNARPAKKGLLLICAIAPDMGSRKAEDPIYTAFAISFPASKSGQAVTYTVNNVYSDEFGGINEPDA